MIQDNQELTLSKIDLTKIIIALTLYLASLFASNTLGLKIMPFLFGSHFSVAIFSFPIVFITTDVIGEVYGKKMAKAFVWAGFLATAIFIFYSLLSLAMPWAKQGVWVMKSYDQVYAVSVRIALASLLAYIIGEYQDVLTFFFVRQKTGNKWFWLRSNLSNIWSQFLDSAIFMLVAFYGANVYDNKTLFSVIISWWLFKVVMGFLYTPLSYLGIKILKGR